jgi:heme oxygenase
VSARAALRAGTADAHERVDGLFSRLDLARPEHYRLFLLAQAAAHLPIEAALDAAGAGALLDDWPSRRRARLLIADLEDMGLAPPPPLTPPPFLTDAGKFGAIYVLEGSRLGGSLLRKGLPPTAPTRFLAAPQVPGAWRKLLAKLDEALYETRQGEAAIDTARQVFERFEAAGLRYVEFERA